MIEEEKVYLKSILDRYKIKKGEALDIGCGPKQQKGNNCDSVVFPEILIGLDKNKNSNPDILLDFTKEAEKISNNSYKLILLSHMLEDCENPYEVLRSCRRILKVDGILVIIQPDRNKYPRIGTVGANPGHKYDFELADILYMIKKTFLDKCEVINKAPDLSNRSFGLVVKNLKDI